MYVISGLHNASNADKTLAFNGPQRNAVTVATIKKIEARGDFEIKKH